MTMTDSQIDEFFTQGNTLLDDVLPAERVATYDQAMQQIYDEGSAGKTDGIISYCRDPRLYDLYQEPALEAIAKRFLGADEVVINSSAMLFRRPEPEAAFQLLGEHVDIMYMRDDWEAQPRRIVCMLMVMLADLPKGRANTYVRPGSHLMLADELARRGQEPVRAHPVALKDLPDLDWPEPVPVVAKAGQVLVFSTNMIHAGTPNMDDEPRRIMFINFSPRGMQRATSGNHNRAEERDAWRALLRENFRADRRHLMLDDD